MQRTNKETGGTSFHGNTITASVMELTEIMGEPEFSLNSGEDKVNFEWEMETEAGDVFTVYDWKEYRPLTPYEQVEWHIGAQSGTIASVAEQEITAALNP